jgi:succinyl-diaminopimelate desuccinylase
LLTPPSIQVGTIAGGSAVNVTPDLCTAEIDIRFGPGVSVETVMAQIQPLAPAGVALTVSDFKPAVEEPSDSPFVQACAAAVTAETGRRAAIKGVSYYSDGAILMNGLDAPFAILGPGDLGASGQPDETAPVDALLKAVDIYVRIAEDWLSPDAT